MSDPVGLPPSEVVGWIGGISAALAGGLIGVQKVLRIFSADRTEIAKSSAEGSVVELMRGELQRLAEQNRQLAERLNELQMDVINLRSVNSALNETVAALTNQNIRLQGNVDELTRHLKLFHTIPGETL